MGLLVCSTAQGHLRAAQGECMGEGRELISCGTLGLFHRTGSPQGSSGRVYGGRERVN